MKQVFLTILCAVTVLMTGCQPAEITTRQAVSLENLAENRTVVFLSSPTVVKRGEYATVSVKGTPGQLCAIAVHLSSGMSKAKGLEPAVADKNGVVTWTWKVSAQTKPGNYKITVTCGGRFADTYFTVE